MGKKAHRNALPPGYGLHWFRIESVLGQGGFGLTYLARDINLDRLVAIKEYMPSQISMRDTDQSVQPLNSEVEEDYRWGLERFISEARTLTRFEHPHLVRVLNVFETNNTSYMVMNYELGKSLRQVMREGYRFTEEELIQLMFPLMDGLDLVHSQGFVHRDIKPGNIFIRREGGPVLLDFGSARQTRGRLASPTLTTFVSPGYAPIEQYAGKSDRQGPWTDIYGLGATIYETLTGNMPEAAIDRGQMIMEDAGDNLIKVSLLCKGIFSHKFLAAIDHALAFNIQDRPQSIEAWRKEFGVDGADVETLRIASPEPGTFTGPGTGEVDVSTETMTRKTKHVPTATAHQTGNDWTEMTTARPEPLPPAVRPPRPRRRPYLMVLGALGLMSLLLMAYHSNYAQIVRVILWPESAVREAPAVAAPAAVTDDAGVTDSAADAAVSASPGPADQPGSPEALAAEDKITQLLASARQDLAALRLTTPAGNNAYDKFLQVMSLDLTNMEAVRGIDAIADKYLQMVYAEIEENNLEKAGEYLDKADYLRPGQPKIIAARESLDAAIREHNRGNSLFGKIFGQR